MSPERDTRAGVARITRKVVAPPGSASSEEHWHGAEQAKTEKLRVRGLQRRAHGIGYELRHSDYGYALIDAERKPIDGRNDLNLKEIESLLAGARGS